MIKTGKSISGFRPRAIFKATSLLAIILFAMAARAEVPARAGWWKFNDPKNLVMAEEGFGESLILIGTHTPAEGPTEGNGAVVIGTGSYFLMDHGIAANGGGSKVNDYTLQFDFMVEDTGTWRSFFQTNASNNNDGDWFVNTSGSIGVAAVGYSGYRITAGEWYRMVVSVKNDSHFTCYLDGQLLLAGATQAVDGRFSMEKQLLLFADDNGEDGQIYCAELAVWDHALSFQEVALLGGFGHEIDLGLLVMDKIPFLQNPSHDAMTICWHDTARITPVVNFGMSQEMGSSMPGSTQTIDWPYVWHTVRLSGLQPDTRYYYKVGNANEMSQTYSFRTLPEKSSGKKLRFLLLSDTHSYSQASVNRVMEAAKSKITELYGPDLANHFNGILHSGDIVVNGNIPAEFTNQFFQPLSEFTPYLPTMVVAGNHENESSVFYNYMSIDELSAFPDNPGLKEKIWKLKAGNALIIGLNTNIFKEYGSIQAAWLDDILMETESDPETDFVFIFQHHPPYSELWKVINGKEANTVYVHDVLLPVIKKYSKVRQVTYGHTHGFERGTIRSDVPGGDFRIVCNGGGGGALDPWRTGENEDLLDVHITLSHHVYQILEIDPADRSFSVDMYSLGSDSDPRDNELLDTWYGKTHQNAPEKPQLLSYAHWGGYVRIETSPFSGSDSLMSVRYQVLYGTGVENIKLDSVYHWMNVYGVDASGKPIDLNKDLDMLRISIPEKIIKGDDPFYFRVSYRDHNLKWSHWSDPYLMTTTSTGSHDLPGTIRLNNAPNPFHQNTSFIFNLQRGSEVSFRIYDMQHRLIDQIAAGFFQGGTHTLSYQADKLHNGVSFYVMHTNDHIFSGKMIKMGGY